MEIPKFNSASFNQMEETKNSQKISVSSQPNGVHYTTNSDSFVIDMNNLSSHGGIKETSSNSRITLQRNLSRKGFQRGGDKMITTAPDSSSPKDVGVGSTTAEKSGVVPLVSQDQSSIPQVHQITITTGNTTGTTTTTAVERSILRRNSFRRYPTSWLLDPKKVLLFFATVSCLGSMVLIYFTLAIGNPNAEEHGLD